MWHQNVAILVLQNIFSDTRQGGPLAVGDRLCCAPLVHLALAHLTGEPRCDPGQGVSTYATVRGSDVARRVPVMVVA